MRNYISPCNHSDSKLSGSTIESMIDYTKELGIPYFASTDNGYLTGVLRGYFYAKKQDIKFIAGIELYFKDIHCDICQNTTSENIKYFKCIVHAIDQDAYQKIVKMVSDSSRQQIILNEVNYPLFDWSDLEELSKYNTTISTSDVEDIVTKHLLVNQKDNAVKYYNKIKQMFGDRYYPAILPINHDKYWDEIVKVTLNGKEYSIPAKDRVVTNASNRAKAIELTYRKTKHKKLLNVFINKIKYPVKEEFQEIQKVESINQFNSFSYNLQNEANKFILTQAKQNNDLDRVLINHYAYYAHKDDKIVQDMKLGDEYRIYQHQYIQSSEESIKYFKNTLKLPESFVEKLVENSYKWASLFDNFELKYDYQMVEYEDPEKIMMEIINKVGRMKWDNPIYVKQFEEEKNILINNGIVNLIPYFLPIVEVVDFYKKHGKLVSVGRGSAAGFLISYLMGITQIDPIKYGLYSSRFITLDRIRQGNLPDIDCLSGDTEILTRKGYVKIEHLANNYKHYPEVLSFNNGKYVWQKPDLIFKKGESNIFEYEFDNGKTIKATPDHKVLTDHGWIAIHTAYENGYDIRTYDLDEDFYNTKWIDFIIPYLDNWVQSSVDKVQKAKFYLQNEYLVDHPKKQKQYNKYNQVLNNIEIPTIFCIDNEKLTFSYKQYGKNKTIKCTKTGFKKPVKKINITNNTSDKCVLTNIVALSTGKKQAAVKRVAKNRMGKDGYFKGVKSTKPYIRESKLIEIKAKCKQINPNLTVIDTNYINSTKSLWFLCKNGHKFKRSWRSFSTYRIYNCPVCTNTHNYWENQVREIFESRLQRKFNNVRPDFLINPYTNRRLELDGYCPELQLAFEFDGSIHWTKRSNENVDDFKYRMFRDRIKDSLCYKNGVHLIRLSNKVKNLHKLVNQEIDIWQKLKK